MSQRIQVSDTHVVSPEGVAYFRVFDSADGTLVLRHEFPLAPATPAWLQANRRTAVAIADAMNGAPGGAIDLVRRNQRAAALVGIHADRARAPGRLGLAA